MTLLQELRFALRSVGRSPRFTLAVSLSLGVGLGAGATLFSLVDRLMLRAPPGVAAPSRIVRLGLTEETPVLGKPISMPLTGIDYEMLRRFAHGFAEVATYAPATLSLGRGVDAHRIDVTLASASLFSTLGVVPAVGRFYREEEDALGATHVPCVASDAFWRREFGSDAKVLGIRLLVGSLDCTLVGITPRSFTGIDLDAVDLWLPIRAGARDVVGSKPEVWTTDAYRWLFVIGRLSPGVTRSHASEYATVAYRAYSARGRDPHLSARLIALPVLDSHSRSPGVQVVTWLAGGAGMFLALICVNVVSLFLARALARRPEIATRLALGESVTSRFRQELSECVILGVVGSFLSLVIVASLGSVTRNGLLPDSTWVQGALDYRVAAFALALALVIGAVIATVTTLGVAAKNPSELLKSHAVARSTGGRSYFRVHMFLVRIQAVLATVLLTASLCLVKSFSNAKNVDLGFRLDNVIVAQSSLDNAGYTRGQQLQYYRDLYERVRGLPGVASASLGHTNPWRNTWDEPLSIPGRDSLPPVPLYRNPVFDAVTPDYLGTMRMHLVVGRWISEADVRGSKPVIVINQALLRLYWSGRNVLGECLRVGPSSAPCREIVGVVADRRIIGDLDSPPVPAYFLPLAQSNDYNFVPRLFVRARDDASAVAAAVRTVMQADGNLPAADVRMLASQFEPILAPWRLGAFAFTAIGVLATLVALLGLYSVLLLMVSESEREYAVRSALGANATRIIRSVISRGMIAALQGVGVGTIALVVGARWTQPLLFHTTLADPITIGGVAGLLLVVAAAASYPAARRAGRGDIMNALRP